MSKRTTPTIELKYIDCICISARLEEVTIDEVQRVFLAIFQEMQVGPVYLFLCTQDLITLDAELKHLLDEDARKQVTGPVKLIANQATGQMVHVVELPETESHLALLGFFQQTPAVPQPKPKIVC